MTICFCHYVQLPVAHSHLSHRSGNDRKRFKTKISWGDKNWGEAAGDSSNDIWAEKKVRVTALAQTRCLLWRRISIPKLTLPPFARHLLGPFFPLFLSSSLPRKISLMQTENTGWKYWCGKGMRLPIWPILLFCGTYIGCINTCFYLNRGEREWVSAKSVLFFILFVQAGLFLVIISVFCFSSLVKILIPSVILMFFSICLWFKTQKQVFY